MPSLLDSTDYDRFEYRHADEPPLSLEDAIKRVSDLKRADISHFHRIVPTDSGMTQFRVESVSRDQVYADFVVRASDFLNRTLRRRKRRF